MGQMAQELEKYTSGREVGRICKYNGQPLYPKEITARIKEEISHGRIRIRSSISEKKTCRISGVQAAAMGSLCTMLFVRYIRSA